MITNENILLLANQHLNNTPLFVTGIKIGSGNQIAVYIDGDSGVKISDCVSLSRFIEQNLNRDSEDFSLDVSSHGANTPLVYPRQYPKHIGRELEIRLLDGTPIQGNLSECDDHEIKLLFSVKEPKTIGKGKITVTKQHIIKYNQIKESKIKLKF